MHKLLVEKLGLSNIRIRNANRINNSGKKKPAQELSYTRYCHTIKGLHIEEN